MNDLLKEKATCWKIRLKKCMDAGRYTQASFAEALNNKYGTCYGQKDVSRWLNVGTINKNGEVGFPKYDTMVLITDFFCVDVGYLTGETDMDTFTLEKTSDYLHLGGDAIKAINNVTGADRSSLEFGYQSQKYRCILNKFLTSKGFHNLVCNMWYLDDYCSSSHEVWEQLSEKLGDNLLKEAIDCYNGPTDYLNDPTAEELGSELYKAIGMVGTAIDKQHDLSYALKFAHYELQETFKGLIDEIYPEKQ